jgi:hypothetical protein
MMSLSIDMTLRGVLLAGKWATEAELKLHDDEWWRNGLISKLNEYTKPEPGFNYQAFTNNDLIASATMVIFLSQARGLGIDKLKTMTADDQREAVIEYTHDRTSIPIDDLRRLTYPQLAQRALDVMSVFSMEMTLRGVLLAGKWATEAELKKHDDEWWRNGLISKLNEYTKALPEFNYQAFTNNDLIANGAMVVFLSQARGHGIDALKKTSADDQRNGMIVHDNQHTGIPVGVLQGLSNRQLVLLALVE